MRCEWTELGRDLGRATLRSPEGRVVLYLEVHCFSETVIIFVTDPRSTVCCVVRSPPLC